MLSEDTMTTIQRFNAMKDAYGLVRAAKHKGSAKQARPAHRRV